MRLRGVLLSLVLGCSALSISAGTLSQNLAKPNNLRVLAKDSSAADIKNLMDQYGRELGVKCEYCHTQNSRTQQPDYASDDNPAKQTARVMIAMLDEINNKYLAQLDDQKYPVLVTCGNCHQGQADPPSFEGSSSSTRNLRAGGG
jgi:Photosynthetic reaction centre cytochrome C subunit